MELLNISALSRTGLKLHEYFDHEKSADEKLTG